MYIYNPAPLLQAPSEVLFSVGVCVCDLLIFLLYPTRRLQRQMRPSCHPPMVFVLYTGEYTTGLIRARGSSAHALLDARLTARVYMYIYNLEIPQRM